MRVHSGSVVLRDFCSSSSSSLRMFLTLALRVFWSFHSSSMVTNEPVPSSALSTVSRWVRIAEIRSSICFKTFRAFFLVPAIFD